MQQQILQEERPEEIINMEEKQQVLQIKYLHTQKQASKSQNHAPQEDIKYLIDDVMSKKMD